MIAVPVFAEGKPVCDGAFGLKWGDGPEQIKAAADKNEWKQEGNVITIDISKYTKEIPGRTLKPQPITTYAFKGFLGEQNVRISLDLDESGLHLISVWFLGIHPIFKPIIFKDILYDLTLKYGPPNTNTYTEDREYYNALWQIDTSSGKRTNILLHNSQMGLYLVYSLYRPQYKDL